MGTLNLNLSVIILGHCGTTDVLAVFIGMNQSSFLIAVASHDRGVVAGGASHCEKQVQTFEFFCVQGFGLFHFENHRNRSRVINVRFKCRDGMRHVVVGNGFGLIRERLF